MDEAKETGGPPDGDPDERALGLLSGVQQALSELRGLQTVDAVLDRGVEVLCWTCGFDRGVLFRVDDGRMALHTLFFSERPEWAEEIKRFAADNAPKLTHQLLETEMIRRRRPTLVTDAYNDPRTNKALVHKFETTSYAAAPIMPNGQVIGFLHADHFFSGRVADRLDREMLWTFAEGFGYAIERAVMLQRLREQQTGIRQMMASTETLLDELSDPSFDLGHGDEPGGDPAPARKSGPTTVSWLADTSSRREGLLTRRETEVLGLMAEGATNGEIAKRLVISEATVKSHVKHVLRKLRAANRAEAVSKYLRLGSEPDA